MRRPGLLALAVLGCACARLNPAYGDEQDAGSGEGGGTTLVSESRDASGVPDPGLACEEEGFHIEVTNAPACPFQLADTIQCALLTEWGGNRLRGFWADGCDQGECAGRDKPFELGVDGLDLPALFSDPSSDETVCAWIRLGGEPADDACTFDRLEVWGVGGSLYLAVGNGPPDPDPMLARPLMGSPIPITSTFHAETACGEITPCDRSGFRSIVVGSGIEAALPDGEPVPAVISQFGNADDAYSVFNWGLQYDRSCQAWGRWAVVPTAHESLFD